MSLGGCGGGVRFAPRDTHPRDATAQGSYRCEKQEMVKEGY